MGIEKIIQLKKISRRQILGGAAAGGLAVALLKVCDIPNPNLPKFTVGSPDPSTIVGVVMQPESVVRTTSQQNTEAVNSVKQKVEPVADVASKISINTQNPVIGIQPGTECEQNGIKTADLESQITSKNGIIMMIGEERKVAERERDQLKIDLTAQRNQFGTLLTAEEQKTAQCEKNTQQFQEEAQKKDTRINQLVSDNDRLNRELASSQAAHNNEVTLLRNEVADLQAEKDKAVQAYQEMSRLVGKLIVPDQLMKAGSDLTAASDKLRINIIPDLSDVKTGVKTSVENIDPLKTALQGISQNISDAVNAIRNIQIGGQAIKSIMELVSHLPVIQPFALKWNKIELEGQPKLDTGFSYVKGIGTTLAPLPFKLEGVIGQSKGEEESSSTGLYDIYDMLKTGSNAVGDELKRKEWATDEASRIDKFFKVKNDKSKTNYK